jgi:putative metalloenzyme radical SAM/SPASM domain maturase
MNSNQGMESPLSPPALPPYRRAYPSKLFVETTTRCNLGCFMCVKQTDGCGMTEGDLTPGIFAALEPALPHLEALILNGIGEPLLNPHLAEFIRKAKVLMPATGWIGFQTNGLLLTNLQAISLVEAGLDRICLSIDAASPETFRKVREGGDIPDIEHAMAALLAAKERCNRPEVRVGIEFVAMRSNLDELPATLSWAVKHGAAFAIVTQVLPYDEEHAAETLYEACTNEAIELFNRYKAMADLQGLDIRRYFTVRWKYSKNDKEQRLVDLVEAMKAEADGNGLFIDMKKLLQVDASWLEKVAGIFAQAQDVARETGLDLRLPEITLREKRHCSFVEDGGAFVSWEGNISPCYFLWHRYRCFASGWHQQVQPKVFGNLNDNDILEIWNSAAFQSFRTQVMDYDYPHCNSCSLAPCDYVQTDQFEQDCHIREVPCGACLWCMGVFQCLA